MPAVQVVRLLEHDCDPNRVDERVERFGVLTEHAVLISRFCARNGHLLIVRAPSPESVPFRRRNPRGWSDEIANKPVYIKKERKRDGLTKGGFYSDYDILSYWKMTAGTPERLITGNREPPAKRDLTAKNVTGAVSEYLIDAPIALLSLVRATGITEFQHGAQDEYVDDKGKVKRQLANEKFVAFDHHGAIHLVPTTGQMKQQYRAWGLEWPYR